MISGFAAAVVVVVVGGRGVYFNISARCVVCGVYTDDSAL